MQYKNHDVPVENDDNISEWKILQTQSKAKAFAHIPLHRPYLDNLFHAVSNINLQSSSVNYIKAVLNK